MEKLNNEQWRNVFRNIEKLNNEGYKSPYGDKWVTVIYIDSTYALVHDEQLIESGFDTEAEAVKRLEDMEKMWLDSKF